MVYGFIERHLSNMSPSVFIQSRNKKRRASPGFSALISWNFIQSNSLKLKIVSLDIFHGESAIEKDTLIEYTPLPAKEKEKAPY